MKILNKIWPIFTFLAVLTIFFIIFALNNIYPFGELTISWCDMNQQTIPLLCEFKDILEGKQNFFLSLQNAGGMNFFGVYFFNLSSPFTYLVLFFEKSMMPLAVNLMVTLKLALAGCTFTIFLHYLLKDASPFVTIPMGILYAFSGYAMMYYQILSWLDTLYVFPLLLMGLEMMRRGKSNILYIISLFLCVLFHFYLAYAVIIFICLYGAIAILTSKGKGDFSRKFIFGSIISALLSAIIIIPCFIQYTFSMRTGNVLDSLKNSSFLPSYQTTFPTFFVLFLVLPFIILYRKKLFKTITEHSLYGILFLIMLIPVFVEPIAKAFQTFNYMSFPTRYGFINIALGLTLATIGITNLVNEYHLKINLKDKDFKLFTWQNLGKLIANCFVIGFIIAFARFSNAYFIKNKETLTNFSQTLWGNDESLKGLLIYYLILLLFSVVLWVLIRVKSLHKIAVYGVIATLCVVEAFFSCNVYMVSPSNEYKNFKRASQLENLIEDENFYRVKTSKKLYDVNLTGAMGYNSLAHYTSLNRKSYMHMMKELGYSSYWMEVNSSGGSIFTDAVLQNKYCVHYGKNTNSVYQTEDFYVTKNDVMFPSCFYIDKNGNNIADESKERWQIQEDLFNRLTNKENLYEEYKHVKLENVEYKEENGLKTFKRQGEGISKITYSLDVVGKKSLYFDIFNLYTNKLIEKTNNSVTLRVKKNGSTVLINGEYPIQHQNGSLYLGSFSNCHLEVEVTLLKDVKARTFSLFSVDEHMLESAVNEVIGGDFTINSGKIKGKINVEENGILFTTLPYDEGYKAKVNGKKAETYNVYGFLGIEIFKGENNVETSFIPKGFIMGLILFIFGVALFTLYLIFNKQLNKFKHIEKIDKFSTYFIYALGVVVVAIIFVMPVLVNFIF